MPDYAALGNKPDMAHITYRMKLPSVLLLFTGLIAASAASTEDEEIAKNSVTVRFYRLTTDKWSDKSSGFREVLASAANKACSKDFIRCGLTRWESSTDEFSLSNVVIDNTSDEKNNYLSITYFLTFNSKTPSPAKNVTSFVVNKRALKDISISARDDLDDAVGQYIVDISGEAFSPPPNKRYNTIMIPIVFALLIGVIVAAISCYCYRRALIKAASRAKLGERRKKKASKKVRDAEGSPKSKVGPAPQAGASPNGRPKTAKEKSRDEAEIQYGVYDECEMPAVTSRAHTLPPLTADEYETDAESKKRKKKKSKKSKKSKSIDKGNDLEQLEKRASEISGENLSNTASTEL